MEKSEGKNVKSLPNRAMKEILENIHSEVQENPHLEESEVKDIFVDEGFFSKLGYEGFGVDIRSEKHIVNENQPDYFCKDDHGNVIFVIEFKKPSREENLSEAEDQLWNRYVAPLQAEYGVLTDGEEIILYKRGARDRKSRKFREGLDRISTKQASELKSLRKPRYDFRKKKALSNYFEEIDPVQIGEEVNGKRVGQNEFFDTFRLEQKTIFYDMLEKTFLLLKKYIEEEKDGSFPKDAYNFWKEYYAPNPSDIDWYDLPKGWRDIAGSSENKQTILFAVETVQSLLGRLMLAKACEDFNFPNISISRFIVEETDDFRGEVEPVSYVKACRRLMGRMQEELIESVFEQDIYYWWATPAEGLEDMNAREVKSRDWPSEVEDFSNSLINFVASISRFDFSTVEGDPLGELYQHYFTREIRRTLGEFFTPPSIAEYILDSVEYDSNLKNKRVIDPGCGSGTFLVAALEKYKQDTRGDVDWASVLKNLCEQSRIVGLDIHPFAVILAQIRFMLEILPQYKEAIEEKDIVLKRLPIYRTDSLFDETKSEEKGVQQTLEANYKDELIQFEMPLPIRKGGEFKSMRFELPKFKHIQSKTANEIDNRQHYFSCLLAVFDAVKEIAKREERYETNPEELQKYFEPYFEPFMNLKLIAEVFIETANQFLQTVKKLREDYSDGRLLKLIEDVVLSSVLKNDIRYDYVVGNPPWVSKHSRYSGDKKELRLKKKYLSAWGEKDMYMQFMERGLQMLQVGGKLGYIVSNRFLHNQGGQEIRAFLAKNQILELVDFTDYQLFEGATNYSSIVSVEKQVENDEWMSFIKEGTFRNQYQIKSARVRDWNSEIPSLIEQIRKREPTDSIDFFMIDSSRFQERVLTKESEVELRKMEEEYTVDGRDLTVSAKLPQADVWPVASPEEFKLIDQIETSMDMRLGDKPAIRNNRIEDIENLIGDDIRVGVQTSGDGAYVVKPATGIAVEKLKELNVLTVTPEAIDQDYTVETDLLKVDITGEDADRWIPNWNNRLVLVPYIQGDNRAELIRPRNLKSKYERTWKYLSNPKVLQTLSEESQERKEIHNRLAAEFDIVDERENSSQYRQIDLSGNQYQELSKKLRENVDRVNQLDKELWWYRFMRRQNIESLPKPKVLTGDLVQYNKLSFDDRGIMAPHNVSVYAILLGDENQHAIAGILNSSLVEFYHKQHSRIHRGKAYRYIEDHTSRWPVVVPEGDQKKEIENLVERILRLKDLEIKVPQFPEPYIAEPREEGEEFIRVNYTSSREIEEVHPNVQTGLSGGFSVELSDGGSIDEGINSEPKAKYVKEALKGRKLDKSKSFTVPVPLKDSIAEEALTELKNDRKTISETRIEDLEKKIDNIVFKLYGIESERGQEIIYRYNNQYNEIQPVSPIEESSDSKK